MTTKEFRFECSDATNAYFSAGGPLKPVSWLTLIGAAQQDDHELRREYSRLLRQASVDLDIRVERAVDGGYTSRDPEDGELLTQAEVSCVLAEIHHRDSGTLITEISHQPKHGRFAKPEDFTRFYRRLAAMGLS